MFYMIQILFILNIIYFIWSIYLNNKYKEYKNIQYFPRVTVLIPAYNQGQAVGNTIKSVLNSDYPNLEIIVINDGSTDTTRQVILNNIKNTDIKFLDYQKNKGKRFGIYTGVMRSSGDIIVTLDSDSIIQKDSIRNLIIPFTQDQTIGAVAGNILVHNKFKFIPKALSSAFIFGFNFLRPSQSSLNCVLCTPGALSAYRKSAIINNLYKWSKAIFLGKRSNIGQDRALTTIVLKNNYKVVYQKSAVCYTNVPQKLNKMVNMFMRWIRGDIRQAFCLFYFIKNYNKKWNFSIIGLLSQLSIQFIWLLSPFLIIYYIILCISDICYIPIFIISVIILTLFWSILPFYICKKSVNIKEGIYSLLYAFLNTFLLFWIIPYCWLTIWNSKWITRK